MPKAAVQYEMTRSERRISASGRGSAGCGASSSKRSAAINCSQASSPTPITQWRSLARRKTRRRKLRSSSGVEHFGQAFVADAAEDFAEESGVGQDPGRRVEFCVAAVLLQREQRVADVGAQFGVAAEDEAQRLQRAPRGFSVRRRGVA